MISRLISKKFIVQCVSYLLHIFKSSMLCSGKIFVHVYPIQQIQLNTNKKTSLMRYNLAKSSVMPRNPLYYDAKTMQVRRSFIFFSQKPCTTYLIVVFIIPSPSFVSYYCIRLGWYSYMRLGKKSHRPDTIAPLKVSLAGGRHETAKSPPTGLIFSQFQFEFQLPEREITYLPQSRFFHR